MHETNGCQRSVLAPKNRDTETERKRESTYNLELDGNNPEIEDLHRRPQHKVGLQSREVDISEFLRQRPLSAALSNGHVSKEARQTYMITAMSAQHHERKENHSHIPNGAKMN